MHLSQAEVAADLRHPEGAVARTVDGAANYLVAAMCLTPGASSAPICASKFAQRLDAKWAPSFPTTAPRPEHYPRALRPRALHHSNDHEHCDQDERYNDLGNADEHDHHLALESETTRRSIAKRQHHSLWARKNWASLEA